MKPILLILLLSGCSLDGWKIQVAEKTCGGVDKIDYLAQSAFRCVDGRHEVYK